MFKMILLFLLCFAMSPYLLAAEVCTVLETSQSGMKKIEVDGSSFFALTRTQMVQCSQYKKKVASYEADDEVLKNIIKESKEKDQAILALQQQLQKQSQQIHADSQLIDKQAKLIAKFEVLNGKYQGMLDKSIKLTDDFEKTGTSLAHLNKKYEEHVQSWADHAEECRQLASHANSGIVFDLGVGLTSGTAAGSSKAAGILGVGFQGMKVWGFMQQGNSGALIGVSKSF